MAIKFDATVNVATVVAIIGLLVTGAAGYASGESRITKAETKIDSQQTELDRFRAEIRDDLKELRQDQKRILNAVESANNRGR
jgi:cell division protein FtsL